MKKTKIVTAINVALMASMMLSSPSYANNRNGDGQQLTQRPIPRVTLPESRNPRQRTKHDARKEAAQRLKLAHIHMRAEMHKQSQVNGKTGGAR